jgi:hypothetical protein
VGAMNSDEILETVKACEELIKRQQEEIRRLRLAIALLEYSPPKRETRGRKPKIEKKIIDALVKMEPELKVYFAQNGQRYSRMNWVYKALVMFNVSPSEWRARKLQNRAIKNMIDHLKKIPK